MYPRLQSSCIDYNSQIWSRITHPSGSRLRRKLKELELTCPWQLLLPQKTISAMPSPKVVRITTHNIRAHLKRDRQLYVGSRHGRIQFITILHTEKSGLESMAIQVHDFSSASARVTSTPTQIIYQLNNLFISNSTPSRKMKKAAFDNLLAIDFNATTRFVFCNFR